MMETQEERTPLIRTHGLTLRLGKKTLFKDVNISFERGGRYAVIGTDGAGKTMFLRLLAGEGRGAEGSVEIAKNIRISMLHRDHYAYEGYEALRTVMMGEGGAGAVRGEHGEEQDETLAEAEAEARQLLAGLGIDDARFSMPMAELSASERVRVLLAQALFGSPDILLLDEPTSHLDSDAIAWLEWYLSHFQGTVILVSHDRHFINGVCNYICDICSEDIHIHEGDFSSWSRTVPSHLRPPTIEFPAVPDADERPLHVERISKRIDGGTVLRNVSFTLRRGEKVAFVGANHVGKSMLLGILMGREKEDGGWFRWGETSVCACLPADCSPYFDGVELDLMDWLRQYAVDASEERLRDVLGLMRFSGEDLRKRAGMLSAGERVRCMLARMMLSNANVLLLEDPTEHLDLRTIVALNRGLVSYRGTVLFTSHDHELIQTVASRIIDVTPDGIVDRVSTYDDFMANETVKQQIAEKYHMK